MTDKPKDGGPAFPRAGHNGMSLRQYYTSHAPPMTDQWLKDSPKEHITETIAAWNFKYADSMLAEQEK